MDATGQGMGFLASCEESVLRLRQWKPPDPGQPPLHHDEDFEWMRDRHPLQQSLVEQVDLGA